MAKPTSSDKTKSLVKTKSAVKRVRQSLKRRANNRAGKSKVLTAGKKLEDAIKAGDKVEADKVYSAFTSVVDKAAKRNFISANSADRKKSRLNARVKAMA